MNATAIWSNLETRLVKRKTMQIHSRNSIHSDSGLRSFMAKGPYLTMPNENLQLNGKSENETFTNVHVVRGMLLHAKDSDNILTLGNGIFFCANYSNKMSN